MLFGLDKATQTFLLFLFTLFVFFIVPCTYRRIKREHLLKLQNRPLLLDWRVLTVCVIYAIIFGFRYNYLNDWEQYVVFYEYVQKGGENEGWREPGFYLFVKFLSSIGCSYYALFVAECFLWIFSICYLFKDNRQYLIFVLPLVFMTTTEDALNISRQYLALSFLLMAYRDYWDEKKIRALILALIAPMLHFSAFIWLIAFYIIIKIDYIKPVWIVASFLIVTVAASLLFDVLSSSTEFITVLINSIYESRVYDNSEIEALQSEAVGATFRQIITLGLVRGLYIYLYYYFHKRHLFCSPILNSMVLIGMIGIVVVVLLGYNLVFSRIAAYIRVFYHIGWGILVYITFVSGHQYIKSHLKLYVFLAMFYMLGSFCLHYGPNRRAEIKDVNPYLIYELR